MQYTRRMSIRGVAMTYGLPARAVARAVAVGDLPAARTVTETGRERVYILPQDAEAWVESLNAQEQLASASGSMR
jgi:hypothetical protein